MIIDTSTLVGDSRLLPSTNHQVYCGLDCSVMLEINETLWKEHPPGGPSDLIYEFEKALQGPYLDMMLRGFKVDLIERDRALQRLDAEIALREGRLNVLASATCFHGLNARSRDQLIDFFYSEMHLPEIWLSQKGQRKLSMNREALEKLEQYVYAKPFITLILSIRDLAKQREVLRTQVDPDGRMRTSYNIAGTETGRPSSSSSALGTGGNLQNIAPHLRRIFVADPGYKLCVIDLEQAEAREEGFLCGCLFGDWSFLNAAESGDLHTTNARLVWPELGWTGDLKKDRQIADGKFYRDFSFRDMAKRGGHLTDYMGTAWTMSRALKIPQWVAEDFQARFCRGRSGERPVRPAYPCIPRYWRWVAEEIQTKGLLTTPFGRRRHFFGRPEDDATLREAIAFIPQSMTADRMNLGLLRIWRHLAPQWGLQVLAQTYDSVTFQYPEACNEQEVLEEALKLVRVELERPDGRPYVVPGEAKMGWNWANASKENPEGLEKPSPRGDPRRRTSGLQRTMMMA